MRYSHANEEPIRENKGEDASSGCLGGKVCTGTGLIKTSFAGTRETVLIWPEHRRKKRWHLGVWGNCPKSPLPAYLRGREHCVLVKAEHCVGDDVVVGQETAAHDLGESRREGIRRTRSNF